MVALHAGHHLACPELTPQTGAQYHHCVWSPREPKLWLTCPHTQRGLGPGQTCSQPLALPWLWTRCSVSSSVTQAGDPAQAVEGLTQGEGGVDLWSHCPLSPSGRPRVGRGWCS